MRPEKTAITTEDLEKSKLLAEGKVEYSVDRSALHISSGIGVARSSIRNTMKISLASTADPLRVPKSVTLTIASLVTCEVGENNTIAKGGKPPEVAVDVDITAPDKIGIPIKVMLIAKETAVPSEHLENDSSCTVVRSEEYPFYLTVKVAADVVKERYPLYEETYLKAEHAAVYGTLLLTDDKKASTGSSYPTPEDEGRMTLLEH